MFLIKNDETWTTVREYSSFSSNSKTSALLHMKHSTWWQVLAFSRVSMWADSSKDIQDLQDLHHCYLDFTCDNEDKFQKQSFVMEALQPSAAGKNQFNALELVVSKNKGLQQRKMINKAPLLRFCFHFHRIFKCVGRIFTAIVIVFHI